MTTMDKLEDNLKRLEKLVKQHRDNVEVLAVTTEGDTESAALDLVAEANAIIDAISKTKATMDRPPPT